MTPIRINSVSQYIDQTNEVLGTLASDLSLSERAFFRGHSQYQYKLLPSIARQINPSIHNNPLFIEKQIITEAKLRLPHMFANERYEVNMLAKMQHYGIKTRLLDFTENPVVALYFACIDETAADGAVYMFVEKQENIETCYSPVANAIAHMYDRIGFFFDDYIRCIEDMDFFKVLSLKYNQDFFSSRDDYIKELVEDFNTPLFVLPEQHFERQIRQQAAFMIFPNRIGFNDESHAVLHDDIAAIEIDPRLRREFLINSASKQQILKELHGMGFNKSTLFPEPENICSDIMQRSHELFNMEKKPHHVPPHGG